MAREHTMLLLDQGLPARILVGRPGARRKLLQLAPALVVLVDGIEERDRLGGMNQDGYFELAAQFKDLIVARVVDVNALAP